MAEHSRPSPGVRNAALALLCLSTGCSDPIYMDRTSTDEAGIVASDAGVDAADADSETSGPVDRDGGFDGGGQSEPACPETLRCLDDRLYHCENGLFSLQDECEFACYERACTGVCKPDSRRCGEDGLVPERCAADGSWAPNPDENAGEPCPFVCSEGACVGECRPTTEQCDDNTSQLCGEDGLWTDRPSCVALCREASCEMPSSCAINDPRCGSNESCCVSHVVAGGEFMRSFDGVGYTDATFAAKVSPFRLDRFEVTVGRFRQWLAVYRNPEARPAPGAGKNPNDPTDTGWDATWDAELLGDVEDLKQRLSTCADTTWTSGPTEADDMPINCVTWHEAYAFCVWDGGRLPSEAEWNFAAAGGAEQRVFPWSDPPESQVIDSSYAVYHGQPIAAVGSRPAGDGRWQHADLGGNVQEWVLDWSYDPYRISECEDCADHAFSGCRAIRGGNYDQTQVTATASWRDCNVPDDVLGRVGFRCARAE